MSIIKEAVQNAFIRQTDGVDSYFFEYKNLYQMINLPDYYDILADEIQVSEKYARQAMKDKYLMGRLMVKSILSLKQDINALQVHIKTDMNGKPYAEALPDFNISHTENELYIVMSSKYAIGCDIEKVERFNDKIIQGACYFCSGKELDALKRVTDKQIQAHFLCGVWTLKEAVLKAIGRGFLYDPRSFSVREDKSTFLNSIELEDMKIDLMTGYFKADLMFALARYLPNRKESG